MECDKRKNNKRVKIIKGKGTKRKKEIIERTLWVLAPRDFGVFGYLGYLEYLGYLPFSICIGVLFRGGNITLHSRMELLIHYNLQSHGGHSEDRGSD